MILATEVNVGEINLLTLFQLYWQITNETGDIDDVVPNDVHIYLLLPTMLAKCSGLLHRSANCE